MKKILLTGLFASLIVAACFAQKPYKVVFYNFENLFDTINEPGVLDEEFTPEGPKKWNTAKYTKKLGNLERVLFDIAAEDKDFPVVIGVSEIENRSVMEDVIAQPKLAHGNYRIVHYDSPDARGVDVGFYYRPDVFKLEGSAAIPFKMPEMPNFKTRDFVTMWGHDRERAVLLPREPLALAAGRQGGFGPQASGCGQPGEAHRRFGDGGQSGYEGGRDG